MALIRENPDRYFQIMAQTHLMDGVKRENAPDEMDLSGFSSSHIAALARTALWFASEETDARAVQGTFTTAERETLEEIRRSVLLSEVQEVLRQAEAQLVADAEDSGAAF